MSKSNKDKAKAKALSVNFKKAHFSMGTDALSFTKTNYDQWRSKSPIDVSRKINGQKSSGADSRATKGGETNV
jgi:hypothetical protein